MGANNKVCPNCGRKMKQQFIQAENLGLGAFQPFAFSINILQQTYIGG